MGNVFKRKKECRILFMGLDAAGKTTILYRMKLGEVVTTIPTIGFNVETVTHKNLTLTCWDIGGRDKMRPLYRHYFPNTDAIIFVVDSSDYERMPDVKEEIHRTVSEVELQDVIVAVFANKQDLDNVMGLQEMSTVLELDKIKQNWAILPTSGREADGLDDAFDWLSSELARKEAASALTHPLKETADGAAEMFSDGKQSIQKGFSYVMNVVKGFCGSRRAVTAT